MQRNSEKGKFSVIGLLCLSFLALVCLGAHSLLEAYTSVQEDTIEAGADFSGLTGTVRMDPPVLKSMSNSAATPTSIAWIVQQTDDASADTVRNVVFDTSGDPRSGWVMADTYLELNNIVLSQRGGIQVYTDNRHQAPGQTVPAYNGDLAFDPAGLYALNADNTVQNAEPYKMAWRITDQPLTSTDVKDYTIKRGTKNQLPIVDCDNDAIEDDYPNRLWVESLGACFPAFLWFRDSSSLDNAATTEVDESFDRTKAPLYARAKDALRGTQIGESTFSRTDAPDYIYFAADFSNAVAGLKYFANVVVETYKE